MVEDRITDGHRIAQLLASEVTGRETGHLSAMTVVEADPDVEPTDEGTFAYGVDHGDRRLADAYVRPDGAYLELSEGDERAAEAAAEAGLRRQHERDLRVFVESGAGVKAAVDVLVAAADADTGDTA